MIIKFKRDYIGRETAMQEYKAGEQADLPNAQAMELVRMDVASEVWAEVGKLYDLTPTEDEVKPVKRKKK